MKKLLLASMFVWITAAIGAQEPNYQREYGKITGYELAMKEYAPDRNAEAVVLYETGKYFFTTDYDRGFLLIMEVKSKVKILTQAGIKYAEFEIPYYVSDEVEDIYDLEATTYNLTDGRVEKTILDKKTIYEETPAPNWRVKKFAMPNVREGSVVEVKYTIKTPYFFNMREWMFQKKIPVVYSMLEYRAIPYYEYVYILKGTNKFDEFSNEVLSQEHQFRNLRYKEVAFKMGMKEVPAFRDEEFITSANDYMLSLNFQISAYNHPGGGRRAVMSTWPLICDELLKHEDFGKYIKASEKVAQKKLAALNSGGPSKETLKDIVQYVKMNYNWNGVTTKYASLKASDFDKKKIGNSADINLFLIGMLKSAGFTVSPIALSTRKHGIVSKNHPFIQFMNYAIAQVELDGETYLLDATEPAHYFDELPQRCIHVNGLVVRPKSDTWIFTEQKNPSLTEKKFHIGFNETADALKVDAEVTAYTHDAYNYRSVYKKDEANLINMLRSQGIEPVGEIETKNYSETELPFVFTYHCEPAVEQANGKLFIAPFLNQARTENIFKQAVRTLPVDLILFHAAKYESTIEIPDGYEVDFLPENKRVNNKFMKIGYEINRVDNKLHVKAEYEFMQNMYLAKEYQALKMTYDYLVSKCNEMIVLVRKE